MKEKYSYTILGFMLIFSYMLYPVLQSKGQEAKERLITEKQILQTLQQTVIDEETYKERCNTIGTEVKRAGNQLPIVSQGIYVVEEVAKLVEGYEGQIIALEEGELSDNPELVVDKVKYVPYQLTCLAPNQRIDTLIDLLIETPYVEVEHISFKKVEEGIYTTIAFRIYVHLRSDEERI